MVLDTADSSPSEAPVTGQKCQIGNKHDIMKYKYGEEEEEEEEEEWVAGGRGGEGRGGGKGKTAESVDVAFDRFLQFAKGDGKEEPYGRLIGRR